MGLKKNEFKLGGVLILFNNLLQSLFKSQILTLGFVIAGIFIMFLILFRNLTLSLIGVVPNFIAAFFILGIIGLLGIPLDMMTITIAAITIGIAVDNSIHYIYRFREEFQKNTNYHQTVEKMSCYCWRCNFKYFDHNCFWFFYFVFIKFYTDYLILVFFTGIAMLLALISVFNAFAKINFINTAFW